MKDKIFLTLIVLFHSAIAVGNIIALPFLIFKAANDLDNWYIYLPLATFIVVISLSRVMDCPLTNLENKLRKKLNLKPIQGFVKHYIIKLFRKLARFILQYS